MGKWAADSSPSGRHNYPPDGRRRRHNRSSAEGCQSCSTTGRQTVSSYAGFYQTGETYASVNFMAWEIQHDLRECGYLTPEIKCKEFYTSFEAPHETSSWVTCAEISVFDSAFEGLELVCPLLFCFFSRFRIRFRFLITEKILFLFLKCFFLSNKK